MKKTMSVSEFKEFILNEAKKLLKTKNLKEEKARLEKTLSENKYSEKASNFIGHEIGHLIHDKDYSHDRAVAASINIAKDKGYKVPEKKEESIAPSAGLTHKEKSDVVHKAKAGEDIGHKGKGFAKVAAKAAREYGSKEAGEKVAAASMWKNIKRESTEISNGSPSDLKVFKFKVTHDNGVANLKTKATSLEAAKKNIMKAEGCPENALKHIE